MFQAIYVGIIAYEKFVGVQSGRSVWKQTHLRLRSFYTIEEARKEVQYFVDFVLPSMGVKLIGYQVESELTDIMDSPCLRCNAPKECCSWKSCK